MKKLLNFDHPFNQKLLIFLITISIAPPTAFLISVLSLSFMGKPYSLRDVLIFTPIITFIVFWIVLLIINQYLRLRSPLGASNLRKLLNTKSLIFVFIPLLLFIAMFTWILFNVEDLQGINYLPPNYRYQLQIFPDANSSGEICIEQITNYRGDIFKHNRAIQDLQITGNWQQNKNRCLFYLESGDQGVINIDYVGAIDDTLTFLFQVKPDSRAFNISSSPGQSEKVNLLSEINGLVSAKFKMGTFLLRNITDWGVLAGLFSAAIIFLIIIYLVEKRWIEKADVKPFFKTLQYQKLMNFFSQPISEKTAVFVLFFIYVIGVLLTLFITRPLAVGPSHFGDEVIYWETALSLYDGSFSPSQFFRAPPFYPISILPAFYLFYPENAYLGAKILNALYFTSAIFPAYLLLRMFIDRKKSILVAALFLLNPAQIIFPPRILSESLFFPMLLWAILLGLKNYDQQDKRKPLMSALLGALISLLYLTRYIALVLIPAFLIIWWLKPENTPSTGFFVNFKNKIKSFVWVLIPMGVILGSWIVFGILDGLSFKESIGFHEGIAPNPEQLTFGRLLMWGVYHVSYSILLAAPFIPLVVALILDFKQIDADRKRWGTSLTLIIVFMLIACIRHAWMQIHNYPIPTLIQGRYIFFFNHLFLVTAAISLTNEQEFSKRIRIFSFSGLLVALAFAIIQIGFIFINRPIRVSISSPYGRFMDAYGPGFLTFSLILILFYSSLPFLKKSMSKSILFLFLLGFYTIGGIKAYKAERSNNSQMFNSQIYYLINEGLNQCENYSKGSEEIIEIYYSEDIEDWELRYWSETLNFYGFTDAKLFAEYIPENPSNNVFRVEYGDCQFKLRAINQEQFQISNHLKFSYGSKYFEYATK